MKEGKATMLLVLLRPATPATELAAKMDDVWALAMCGSQIR